MNKTFKIRQIKKGEETKIFKLVKPIFDKFVAPTFSSEGIQEFLKIIKTEAVKDRIKEGNRKILFAEEIKSGKIIGILEFKNFNHISIFFVKSKYQGLGIGNSLLSRCMSICKRNNKDLKKITVHSSPNAVEIYKKFGFKKIGKGEVRQHNGIKFVSMKLIIK